jgi:pantothenate kinase-related protein Tda10
MTDEQVINFVDRYMPAYELFLEGVRSPDARWHGNALAVQLGEEREIVGTSKF